jgi:3-deoxy-D-manno-octulosonate cytidylyltransferase
MLATLRGKSIIRRTYESAVQTGLFSEVVVVTDSQEIFAEIAKDGGRVVMSTKEHESGTDRIAEVVPNLSGDIFVNIQGDEPFVQREPLRQLLSLFDRPGTKVASLVQTLKEPEFIADPNFVKVALDLQERALFFSRSVIPFPRNAAAVHSYYEHIGVYGFRRDALMEFISWAPSPLELVEKIECLRFLEHGVPIQMAITNYMGVEIDTPEDMQRAESAMDQYNWK